MKKDKKTKLDEYLGLTFRDFGEDPSPGVWDSIANDISKLPEPPAGSFFRLTKGAFLVSMIDAILLVAGVFAWLTGAFPFNSGLPESGKLKTLQENRVNTVYNNNGNPSGNTHTGISPEMTKSLDLSSATSSIEKSSQLSVPGLNIENTLKTDYAQNQPAKNIDINTSKNEVQSETKPGKKITDQNHPVSGAITEKRQTKDNKIQSKENSSAPIGLSKSSKENGNQNDSKMNERYGENHDKADFPHLTPNKKTGSIPLYAAAGDFFTMNLRDETSLKDFSTSTRKNVNYFDRRSELKISAFFQPQFLSAKNRNYSALLSTAGLAISLNKNRLLAESGLEVYQVKHQYEYNMTYNKYLGSYQRLDSIIFINQGGTIIPDKVTTTVKVFDPSLSNGAPAYSVTYSYLRIPLLVGYEFPLSRFSLSVKTGILAVFLLNKKSGELTIPGQDRIISLEARSSDVNKTEYQWALRAGIHYDLTDKYGIILEPGLIGYLSKPSYQLAGDNSKPSWYSVKFGIFWKP